MIGLVLKIFHIWTTNPWYGSMRSPDCHSSLSLREYRCMYWSNLFISILTFFAHTFFYKQLDLGLLETLQVIFFPVSVKYLPSHKSALILSELANGRSNIEKRTYAMLYSVRSSRTMQARINAAAAQWMKSSDFSLIHINHFTIW